jgi:hypothetical protein
MKDKIAEINKEIRDGINHWAYFMIMAEADQWAVNLNYDTTDLMNAVYIFQHIASNIGIKNGHIDEVKAVEFGNRLRELIKDMTGYDPHELNP